MWRASGAARIFSRRLAAAELPARRWRRPFSSSADRVAIGRPNSDRKNARVAAGGGHFRPRQPIGATPGLSQTEFGEDDAADAGPLLVVNASRPPANPRPTIHDPPRVVKPGEFVDIGTVTKFWWSFPAVGFNSILEMPVAKFEAFPPENPPPVGTVVVPNSIFGVPIRKDLVHRVYWYHRKAMNGYDDTMQFYKWEWPGSNKKARSQKKSGKGRMGRRKAPGMFEGSFSNPKRPHDTRLYENHRVLWRALKCMLSAKYVQDSIKVVDSFNLQSHKTKHLVQHLRRIVGSRCRSALLVHEGTIDVNDNFRWASAHIASVNRENVEGLSVYNLLRYHQIIFTEAALAKLIQDMQEYPKKRGWGQVFATPDGMVATPPEKVEGWNNAWIEKKERLRKSEFRARDFFREQQKWKWSHTLKGPLKIPRSDPLAGFRVKDFMLNPEGPAWEKLESLYVDDEPLEEEPDEDEFSGLLDTMDGLHDRAEEESGGLIEDPKEIQQVSLGALAAGRKNPRSMRRLSSASSEGGDEGKGGKS